jgi:hypothetical protein
MNENSTQIINNYHIDAMSLVGTLAAQEQEKIINALKAANVLFSDNGELFAVAYDNWADRAEEGHEPKISLKKVG